MIETFRALRDSAAGAMFVRLLVLVALLGGALAALSLWHRSADTAGSFTSHTVRAPVLIPVAAPPAPAPPQPSLTKAEQRRWFRPLEAGSPEASFRPRQGIAPGAICAVLGGQGWTKDRAGALPGSGREECAMERTYPRAGGGPPTRLFAMARSAWGDEDSALDLRMKANLHDEATASEVGRDWAATLDALFSLTGQLPDEAILAKVAAFQPFEAEVGGVKLSLKAERAEIRRFNLSLLLPRPLEARDPAHLAPIPADERRLAERLGLVASGPSADASPTENP